MRSANSRTRRSGRPETVALSSTNQIAAMLQWVDIHGRQAPKTKTHTSYTSIPPPHSTNRYVCCCRAVLSRLARCRSRSRKSAPPSAEREDVQHKGDIEGGRAAVQVQGKRGDRKPHSRENQHPITTMTTARADLEAHFLNHYRGQTSADSLPSHAELLEHAVHLRGQG